MCSIWCTWKSKATGIHCLCRPHVKYILSVWDPSTKPTTVRTRHGAKNAICFPCKLKEWGSVTQALEKLNEQTLGDRCETNRRSRLLRHPFFEKNHRPLINSSDELMSTRTSTPATRAAEKGDRSTINAKSSVYRNNFLPKTVENSRLNVASSPNC